MEWFTDCRIPVAHSRPRLPSEDRLAWRRRHRRRLGRLAEIAGRR